MMKHQHHVNFKAVLWGYFGLLGYTLSVVNALLFTPTSNLGFISSLSVPVVEYFPERRILVDWCFIMGYDLPVKLSSFYNIPIWPGFQNPKAKRSISADAHKWDIESTHSLKTLQKNYDKKLDNDRHPSDFSAGELYQGIEDYLVSYGFDETCLLRSVCELARHPFDDSHRNLFTELLTFLLTPSQHRGFDVSEQLYRETYEHAEYQGFLGHEQCAQLYPKCKQDLLSAITHVLFD